jgi:hypothetical protein
VTVLNRLLNSPDNTKTFIADAVSIAHKHSLNGYNWDLEVEFMSANLTCFMSAFVGAMHAASPSIGVSFAGGHVADGPLCLNTTASCRTSPTIPMDRWISMSTYTNQMSRFLKVLSHGVNTSGSAYGIGLCPLCFAANASDARKRFDAISQYGGTVKELYLWSASYSPPANAGRLAAGMGAGMCSPTASCSRLQWEPYWPLLKDFLKLKHDDIEPSTVRKSKELVAVHPRRKRVKTEDESMIREVFVDVHRGSTKLDKAGSEPLGSTAGRPFGTLSEAVAAVRGLPLPHRCDLKITIAGGNYGGIENALRLTEADSGCPGRPIVYRATHGSHTPVVLHGGVEIKPATFKPSGTVNGLAVWSANLAAVGLGALAATSGNFQPGWFPSPPPRRPPRGHAGSFSWRVMMHEHRPTADRPAQLREHGHEASEGERASDCAARDCIFHCTRTVKILLGAWR